VTEWSDPDGYGWYRTAWYYHTFPKRLQILPGFFKIWEQIFVYGVAKGRQM
jgi:hypothetical protein